MDIARYSIEKPVVTWLLVIICLIGGIISYSSIGRLEDPEFTIKEAKIYTSYPGATAEEVEQEVTDRLERAIQQVKQLRIVTSKSKPGVSEITAEMQKKYGGAELQQIWDELRRKVNDAQDSLPPGVLPSLVNDDFGDVYGVFYALTGEGYSYRDLNEFAKYLRTNLLLIPGIAKVAIDGKQNEEVFVEISNTTLADLGIPPEEIYQLLETQNAVSGAGNVRVDSESVRISPTGEFTSVQQLGDLLIKKAGSERVVRMDDIARIERGYEELPGKLIMYNGKPALTIGISIASGNNVVVVGEKIEAMFDGLVKSTPLGIELHSIYSQPQAVTDAVDGFVISLAQAIAIVIVILLLFMGLRAGLVIGVILLLTVLGTLVVMKLGGIELQRISLGALIIAMGMLVDNAIVVAEGILIRVQMGKKGIDAASEVVAQNIWPLFGATVVGILAFAAIGLSEDSTGEYTISLFYVILISLTLSWVLAVTVTPLFCNMFFIPSKNGVLGDPYGHTIYRWFKSFLSMTIKFRWVTISSMVIMLFGSIVGFGYISQSFFPDSTTPNFMVHYWRAQGTDIREVQKDMEAISSELELMEGVVSVTSFVGGGPSRFMLTLTPEQPNSSYGLFLVKVDHFESIDNVAVQGLDFMKKHYPQSDPSTEFIVLGPGGGSDIEARVSGPDSAVLRQISEKIKDIYYEDYDTINIKDDWRNPVKVIRPVFGEAQARAAGITRQDLTQALEKAFVGLPVGVYRERDELLPIVVRPPDEERMDVGSMWNIPIWSAIRGTSIPIGQIITGIKTETEDTIIHRRNKIRTITVLADANNGFANDAFKRIRPKVDALALPIGYSLEWGGEYENSKEGQEGLAAQLPMGFLSMILVVILLFAKVRQPLIIWLCVPLALIGVTVGLLVMSASFGFMALLGMLSLSGMLIKNAIVLIEQIDMEIEEGKDGFYAIIDSTVSRLRPVSMAAITTIFGMIPLLSDVFFKDMAITIMAGLGFATVLTLIVVPTLYAVFFKIPYREMEDVAEI